MNIEQNVILAPYTSWLIGGPADYFCLPENEAELQQALSFSFEKDIPYTILGGGTNVLISDKGVRGLVIGMKKFSTLKVTESDQNIIIQCLAGVAKAEVLKILLKYKHPAALFLAGLPGDIGGGVVMNAGVAENFKPREFAEIVKSIKVWQVEKKQISKKTYQHQDLNWNYRHSVGWQPGIITEVELSFPKIQDDTILEQVKNANRNRLNKQPLDKPSCGSVFMNPEGQKAAQLIDVCGLKGLQIGEAQVSLKHANFIVNLGLATAADTWNLILKVQKEVFAKKQIHLRTEVIRLGDWDN